LFINYERYLVKKIHQFTLIAALSLTASGPLLAAQCTAEISGNDAMKFDKTVIEVSKSCKEFTLNLKHVGKLPKASMGHNWVLTKTADMQGVANEGITAGPANDYIKPNDARVIAHTKLIGGGETASVKFPVSKLEPAGAYSFFCSFPGHVALMKGEVKLVN